MRVLFSELMPSKFLVQEGFSYFQDIKVKFIAVLHEALKLQI